MNGKSLSMLRGPRTSFAHGWIFGSLNLTIKKRCYAAGGSGSKLRTSDSQDSAQGFGTPSPIPLPPEEQREMQRLMREAANEFESQNHQQQETENQNKEAESAQMNPQSNGINPLTGERDGPKGPEPTRFGDWERKGRVYDF